MATTMSEQLYRFDEIDDYTNLDKPLGVMWYEGFVVPVEPDEDITLDEGAYTRINGPVRVLIFGQSKHEGLTDE